MEAAAAGEDARRAGGGGDGAEGGHHGGARMVCWQYRYCTGVLAVAYRCARVRIGSEIRARRFLRATRRGCASGRRKEDITVTFAQMFGGPNLAPLRVKV